MASKVVNKVVNFKCIADGVTVMDVDCDVTTIQHLSSKPMRVVCFGIGTKGVILNKAEAKKVWNLIGKHFMFRTAVPKLPYKSYKPDRLL